jgi:hypothetical protein
MKIHVALVPIPPSNPTGPDPPGTVYLQVTEEHF